MAKVPTGAEAQSANKDEASKAQETIGTPRYASTDEFRAEFGSYRVNNETEKLSDSESAEATEAKVEPSPSSEQIPTPEGN